MTENTDSGCSQRDSAEHEGYVKAWHTNSDRPNNPTGKHTTVLCRGIKAKMILCEVGNCFAFFK